ncbi:hypothetical protein MTYM_02206 [Methylococcales bacterium]|nr:hypothetical protein MTYM_02206 [Methylococcales bacterium]
MPSNRTPSGKARTQKPKPARHSKPASDGIPDALKNWDSLPDSANVRQPVVKALFACSDASVWRYCKSGLIPKPKKLGFKTVWNVGEIRKALNDLGSSSKPGGSNA